MESYIIRIYRRGKKNSRRMIGIIEEVSKEIKHGFENVDDLWNILKGRTENKSKAPEGEKTDDD